MGIDYKDNPLCLPIIVDFMLCPIIDPPAFPRPHIDSLLLYPEHTALGRSAERNMMPLVVGTMRRSVYMSRDRAARPELGQHDPPQPGSPDSAHEPKHQRPGLRENPPGWVRNRLMVSIGFLDISLQVRDLEPQQDIGDFSMGRARKPCPVGMLVPQLRPDGDCIEER